MGIRIIIILVIAGLLFHACEEEEVPPKEPCKGRSYHFPANAPTWYKNSDIYINAASSNGFTNSFYARESDYKQYVYLDPRNYDCKDTLENSYYSIDGGIYPFKYVLNMQAGREGTLFTLSDHTFDVYRYEFYLEPWRVLPIKGNGFSSDTTMKPEIDTLPTFTAAGKQYTNVTRIKNPYMYLVKSSQCASTFYLDQGKGIVAFQLKDSSFWELDHK